MDERTATVNFEMLLSERVRTRRLRRGWRQEDVAQRMRLAGFDWGQPTVAAVESGRRECSLLEYAALASSFYDPRSIGLGGFFGLDDDEKGYLFHGPDGDAYTVAEVRIELPPDGSVHLQLGAFLSALEGGDWGPFRVGLSGGPAALDWSTDDQMTTKLVRSLGASREDILEAAQRLWGRAPHLERDARLGDTKGVAPRTLQARRGHITRSITTELRGELS